MKETAAEATNSELVKDWTDLIRAWTVRHRLSQRILSTISCGLRLKDWIGVGMFLRYGIKSLYPMETGKDGNGECGLGNVGGHIEGTGYLVRRITYQ